MRAYLFQRCILGRFPIWGTAFFDEKTNQIYEYCTAYSTLVIINLSISKGVKTQTIHCNTVL